MTHYVSVEETISLHKYAVQRFGGSRGIRDRGSLEAALAAPKQTMLKKELYPNIWSKAAILILSLIKNHPFVDGNKRIGLYTMLRLLEINGYELSGISNDELYSFTINIATSKFEKDDIVNWPKSHTKKLK